MTEDGTMRQELRAWSKATGRDFDALDGSAPPPLDPSSLDLGLPDAEAAAWFAAVNERPVDPEGEG